MKTLIASIRSSNPANIQDASGSGGETVTETGEASFAKTLSKVSDDHRKETASAPQDQATGLTHAATGNAGQPGAASGAGTNNAEPFRFRGRSPLALEKSRQNGHGEEADPTTAGVAALVPQVAPSTLPTIRAASGHGQDASSHVSAEPIIDTKTSTATGKGGMQGKTEDKIKAERIAQTSTPEHTTAAALDGATAQSASLGLPSSDGSAHSPSGSKATVLTRIGPDGQAPGEGSADAAMTSVKGFSEHASIARETQPVTPQAFLEQIDHARGLLQGQADDADTPVVVAGSGGVVLPRPAPAGIETVPVGSADWSMALGQEVAQLTSSTPSLSSKSVQLRLDPPHLGPMTVTVSIANGSAHVTLTSPHDAVRQAMSASLPTLHHNLAQQGLTLSQATVDAGGGQDQASRFLGGQPGGRQPSGRSRDETRENGKASPSVMPVATSGASSRPEKMDRLVDTQA